MNMKVGDRVTVKPGALHDHVDRVEGVIAELNGDEAVIQWETARPDGMRTVAVWRGSTEDLIPVMGDDFFGNCNNCVDW
jgi:hypothetical protein